jgi:hypothetical protein
MYMLCHHLHRIDLDILGLGNLDTQLLYRMGDVPNQDVFAVLGSPDNVVFQVINRMCTCFVSHAGILPALRAARFPPHSKLWGIQRDFS